MGFLRLISLLIFFYEIKTCKSVFSHDSVQYSYLFNVNSRHYFWYYFSVTIDILKYEVLVLEEDYTAWKVSKSRVFSSTFRTFSYSDWIRTDTSYLTVLSLKTGKYRPGKIPYLDTFHEVLYLRNFLPNKQTKKWIQLNVTQCTRTALNRVNYLFNIGLFHTSSALHFTDRKEAKIWRSSFKKEI